MRLHDAGQPLQSAELMKSFKSLFLLFTFSLILGLAGCKQQPQASNAEDDSNPFFKQASEFEAQQNYVAAVEEYTKALAGNASLAKAHLQMATIYNERLSDPISALYHYQQYLKLRPDAADRDAVQACIDKCKIDFALSLPNTPLQNADEVARLTRENLELKHTITDLQQQVSAMQAGAVSNSLSPQGKDAEIARLNQELAQLKQALMDAEARQPQVRMLANNPVVSTESQAGSSVATSASPESANAVTVPSTDSSASAQVPAQTSGSSSSNPALGQTTGSSESSQEPSAPTAEPRKHVIAKGDTLWNIASRYYPGEAAEGVKKIKAANKEAAANERNLKLGQILIIP